MYSVQVEFVSETNLYDKYPYYNVYDKYTIRSTYELLSVWLEYNVDLDNYLDGLQ
jgi:hypothetical protein